MQGELTAELLVWQEEGHLLPAEPMGLWFRGLVWVSRSWRAAG